MKQRLLDGFAVAASTLCVIHCLALPLLIVALPSVALFTVIPESFHVGMFLLAVPTSIAALSLGYRRHRRPAPASLAAVGLTLLGFGALADITQITEIVTTVIGGITLALGHVFNGRPMAIGFGTC